MGARDRGQIASLAERRQRGRIAVPGRDRPTWPHQAPDRARARTPSLWRVAPASAATPGRDRKSTRLNSSHVESSYAVFCLKKKMKKKTQIGSSIRQKEMGNNGAQNKQK